MNKVLQERGFGSLPSSTETNPRDQVKSISTTIEAGSNSIRRIGSNQYAVSTGQNNTLLYKSRQMTVPFTSRLDNHYCEEEGNYGPKFMEAYGAKFFAPLSGSEVDNEGVHDLGSVETEFLAIVFNNTLTSETTLSCEPTVSSLNNDEIDFRISFDESDDEDCMIIFDKNSFSYKIIYVNNLKMDSENDNDKVNMPLLPSLKLAVSYFDELDFFKDFENEFPAIVYNDAQTSKSDLLIEPILNSQHINEFNLKNETSLSECDEEKQNVLNFNDIFPFNIIYPNDSKSDKDNDDDNFNIEHSSGDLSIKPLPDLINTDVGAYARGSNKLSETRPHWNENDEVGGKFTKSRDPKVLES
ncbi:hypothetical protein Tco_1407095 [Tanacetum coccineum]